MLGDIFKLFFENKKATIGFFILLFFVGIAIFAPVLAPYNPKANKIEIIEALETTRGRRKTVESEKINEFEDTRIYTQEEITTYKRYTKKFPLNSPPSSEHYFGTTQSGQDIYSQVIWGTRISLTVGVGTGLFTTFIALTLALVAGYFGGLVDDIISLFTNVFLVIPSLPLMIVIAAYITVKGVMPIVLILALTSWPWPTRLLRSQVVSLKNRDFVKVSRSLGERPLYIIFNEMLPNMISLVMASFFQMTMAAIIGEATLEFLGLGNVSIVSWGTILYWAQNNGALLSGAWWWFLPPGIAIALIGTSFAMMNFAIDEISNPKLRKR
ncbi:MAG: ABC transporter permease [Thermotogota bacterium]